jgi:hypothetical protein
MTSPATLEAILTGETDLGSGWTRSAQSVTWTGPDNHGFAEVLRLGIWGNARGVKTLRIETAWAYQQQTAEEALAEAEDAVDLPLDAVSALAEILWFVKRQMGRTSR